MNYRHIYHAGMFADVIKHITLLALIESLKVKDKPFAVMDFFAGGGLYDLNSEEALKTQESSRGIRLLYDFYQQSKQTPPPLVELFMGIIKRYNHNALSYYPASPLIAAEAIRAYDKLILSELHPADYAELKYNMRYMTNVETHLLDAYLAIKAFLPPPQARGLILLDPPFEKKDEFSKIAAAAKLIKKRFSGVLMIWYPIIDEAKLQEFYKELRDSGYKELLKIEFTSFIELEARKEHKAGGIRMHKCGIIIGNPPVIISPITEVLEYLCLGPYAEKAAYKIDWV